MQTPASEAQLDLLATDSTHCLFEHQPLDWIDPLTRRAIVHPWLFISLLKRLRTRRHDLAVRVGAGSLTGVIFTRCIASRYSMGMSRRGEQWFDVEVLCRQHHAYELPGLYAATLGLACCDRPVMMLTSQEQEAGRQQLM